jgi:hypothetical protein
VTLAKDIIAIARRGVGLLANNLLALDASGKLPAVDGSQLTNIRVWDLIVEDQRAANSPGGTAASGWQIRTLNTVLTNNIAGASLISNAVQLPAGTYEAEWEAPANQAGRHRTVLYDNTRAVVLCLGSSDYGNTGADSASTRSQGTGIFTLSSTSSVVVRHWCASGSAASDGFGVSSASGLSEVYTRLLLKRLA